MGIEHRLCIGKKKKKQAKIFAETNSPQIFFKHFKFIFQLWLTHKFVLVSGIQYSVIYILYEVTPPISLVLIYSYHCIIDCILPKS